MSAQETPLVDEIVDALPSPSQAAAGVATSTAGNLIAGAAIPLPIKLVVIGIPLLFIGWRWITRGSRKSD